MTTLTPSAPESVLWIVRTLEEAGHETWTVGGAVRDALAGRPSGDWDLTTQARPDEVQRIFKRTVPIGIDHGTVGVLDRDGTMFEVTTFRKDVETDGRHAVVAFADSVEDDLARRDFTMNAIAWHPLREDFCDPFGGVDDLEAGILRTVGAPGERFAEDYLRVLRAFRFAGRFGLQVDPATWKGMCVSASHLTALSAERLREELIKVLASDREPSRALRLYQEAGALRALYPEWAELAEAKSERWAIALRTVDVMPTGNPLIRLAALLRDVGPAKAAALLTRLRLSNAQTTEVAHHAGAQPLPAPDASAGVVRHWLSSTGPHRLGVIARLDLARARAPGGDASAASQVVGSWRRAKRIRGSGVPLRTGDLAIDGRDLISLGFKPGPHFGEALEYALGLVLDDPLLNDRELLLARTSEWMSENTE